MDNLRAQLHLGSICALYMGPLNGNRPHKHHALQLLLDRKDPAGTGSHGFAVYMPDTLHRVEGSDAGRLLLLLEPESDTGRGVLNAMQNPADVRLQSLAGQLQILADTASDLDSMAAALLALFPGRACTHDPRIERVFTDAARYCRMRADTKSIAAEACLSPERFRHLFREQTGMPLARYLAWRRVRAAAEDVFLNGSDFSMAAYEAGFSDYAHLSRFFKAMFGFNLSELAKNSRNLQVSFSSIP